MQNMENYMQRLAELVLTGMGSEILSCCISSTAICVEVWHQAQGGDRGVPVGPGELSMGFLGCHISTAGICSLKA